MDTCHLTGKQEGQEHGRRIGRIGKDGSIKEREARRKEGKENEEECEGRECKEVTTSLKTNTLEVSEMQYNSLKLP